MSDERTPLAHQFADMEQQHRANTFGMWIFLASELMFFGGLFLGYTVYRLQYPAEFAAASSSLSLAFGGANTIVLLTSSLTMALAVHFAQSSRRDRLLQCLVITALLGAAFLVVKGFEYRSDYHDNLMPGLAFDDSTWLARGLRPERVQLFLVFYYILTIIHATHLIIGIALLAILSVLAWRGRYHAGHYTPIEVMGLYWHFVDIVWIFLLPMLYMVGVRSVSGG